MFYGTALSTLTPNIYIFNPKDQSDNEESENDEELADEFEETSEKEQISPNPLPRQKCPQVTAQAINIAHSLVDTCLAQLCKLHLIIHNIILFIFTTVPSYGFVLTFFQEKETSYQKNLNK